MGSSFRLRLVAAHAVTALYYAVTFFICFLLFIGAAESGYLFPAFLLLVPLFVTWVVFVACCLIPRFRPKLGTAICRLAFPPAMIAFMLVLDNAGIPFKVLWRLALPGMNQLAAQVVKAPAGTKFPPRTIGLFSVSDIEKTPNGLRFRSGYGHPFDWNGFAYDPTGKLPAKDEPSGPGGFTYKPIGDGWYFCYGF